MSGKKKKNPPEAKAVYESFKYRQASYLGVVNVQATPVTRIQYGSLRVMRVNCFLGEDGRAVICPVHRSIQADN